MGGRREMAHQNCKITHEVASVLLILPFFIGIFFIVYPVTAVGDNNQNIFTIVDINGVEMSDVSNLHLSYHHVSGMLYRASDSSDFEVKRGETTHSIPLSEIDEIEFSWSDTDENSAVTVSTESGKQITGQPVQTDDWKFTGNKNSESISQDIRQTSKIVLKGADIQALQNSSLQSDNENKDSFTLVDSNGIETGDITDFHLSYYHVSGMFYRASDSSDFEVKRGETSYSIPFSEITEILFSWSDTDENSTVTVSTESGKQITGQPVQTDDWKFNGNTDYGTINQEVRKTSRIARKGSNTSLLQNPSSAEKNDNGDIFTIIDTDNIETNDVSNLRLSYYQVSGMFYRASDSSDFGVKHGETIDSTPFTDINGITFSWSDTDENSKVTVFTKSGKQIIGQPVQTDDWKFYGNTDYGTINLEVRKTSQIIRKGVNKTSLQSGFAIPGFEGGLVFLGIGVGYCLIMRRNLREF